MGLCRIHIHQARTLANIALSERREEKTYSLNETTWSCRPECLDSEYLPLFHLGLVIVLEEGNRFSAVDLIPFDVVAGKILYWFHGKCLSVDIHLVAFHCLLDRSADIANTNVNSGILPTLAMSDIGLNAVP